MSEIDGRPYVFAWESNSRDWRGRRIVRFRICYPQLTKNRWDKRVFATREAAQRFIAKGEAAQNVNR